MTLEVLQKTAISGAAGGVIHISPAVRGAFSAAIGDVFYAGLGVTAIGICLILLLPEVPMTQGRGHAEPVAEPGEGYLTPDESRA